MTDFVLLTALVVGLALTVGAGLRDLLPSPDFDAKFIEVETDKDLTDD